MKKICITLLLLLFILSGCTISTDKNESETVEIVDFTNETIEVSVNPKKVAIFIPQALDIIDAAGFESTEIESLGVQSQNLPDYLSHYKNEPYINVGTLFEADLDMLDLMAPDMIIYGGRFGAEGRVAEGKTLHEIIERYPDIDFVNLEFGEGDLESNIKKNFDILSAIFPGIKNNLDEVFETISLGFSEIRKGVNDASTLFIMPSGGNLQFYGPNSRFGYVHTDFGFKPAVESDEAQGNHGDTVSPEFIMETNPGIILLLDREAATAETSGAIEDFKTNPLIQETDAYKNNAIFELDPNAWYIMPGGVTSSLQMIKDLKVVVETVHNQ